MFSVSNNCIDLLFKELLTSFALIEFVCTNIISFFPKQTNIHIKIAVNFCCSHTGLINLLTVPKISSLLPRIPEIAASSGISPTVHNLYPSLAFCYFG